MKKKNKLCNLVKVNYVEIHFYCLNSRRNKEKMKKNR